MKRLHGASSEKAGPPLAWVRPVAVGRALPVVGVYKKTIEEIASNMSTCEYESEDDLEIEMKKVSPAGRKHFEVHKMGRGRAPRRMPRKTRHFPRSSSPSDSDASPPGYITAEHYNYRQQRGGNLGATLTSTGAWVSMSQAGEDASFSDSTSPDLPSEAVVSIDISGRPSAVFQAAA